MKIVQIIKDNSTNSFGGGFALDDEGNFYEWDWNDEKKKYDFVKQKIKFSEED